MQGAAEVVYHYIDGLSFHVHEPEQRAPLYSHDAVAEEINSMLSTARVSRVCCMLT